MISLKIYPNVSKTNQKTGSTPLYGRLFEGKQKKEFGLDKAIDLKPSELSKWNQFMKRVEVSDSPINDYLNAFESRYRELITNMRLNGIYYSLEEFSSLLISKV